MTENFKLFLDVMEHPDNYEDEDEKVASSYESYCKQPIKVLVQDIAEYYLESVGGNSEENDMHATTRISGIIFSFMMTYISEFAQSYCAF